jgi:hypothetical protein
MYKNLSELAKASFTLNNWEVFREWAVKNGFRNHKDQINRMVATQESYRLDKLSLLSSDWGITYTHRGWAINRAIADATIASIATEATDEPTGLSVV